MRYLAHFSFIALALAWVSPAAAGDLKFHGYMRAGTGLAAKGGPAVCYNVGQSKFRLGNECDYVAEFTLDKDLVENEDGSKWGVGFMPQTYSRWEGGHAGLGLGLAQVYVYGAGVPQLAKGMIWAGRRYYARLQTGINDQFQEIRDGDGAGIEDMQLGPVKLSVAFLNDPGHDSTGANPTVKPFAMETHAYIPTAEQGELKIFASIDNVSKTNNQSLGEDPPDAIAGPGSVKYNIALYHTLGGILNGSNMVGVKLMSSATSQQIRALVQEGIGVPEIKTSIDVLAVYLTSKARADADAEWSDPSNDLQIGFRTDTHISGPFRFLLEYGHSRIWDTAEGAGPNSSLNKLTAAFAASSGPDAWSRPTVRLYYTHAWWNEGAGPGTNAVYGTWHTGNAGTNAFGNSTSGGTIGVQGETWW